jgi:hypothetical protein
VPAWQGRSRDRFAAIALTRRWLSASAVGSLPASLLRRRAATGVAAVVPPGVVREEERAAERRCADSQELSLWMTPRPRRQASRLLRAMERAVEQRVVDAEAGRTTGSGAHASAGVGMGRRSESHHTMSHDRKTSSPSRPLRLKRIPRTWFGRASDRREPDRRMFQAPTSLALPQYPVTFPVVKVEAGRVASGTHYFSGSCGPTALPTSCRRDAPPWPNTAGRRAPLFPRSGRFLLPTMAPVSCRFGKIADILPTRTGSTQAHGRARACTSLLLASAHHCDDFRIQVACGVGPEPAGRKEERGMSRPGERTTLWSSRRPPT